ncbi:TPA: hypothetical protein N0F65_006650 [Lagenidium giganteum]|uniref:Uncharacterized protein n=1 Tax=Lagenidium giganteum TaxID=4803 RepID=A0AAV2ZAE0_9STRA|nr:TPA: hypothetical protein N0F65_006650 [Lagenidium giganteum]
MIHSQDFQLQQVN